VCRRTADGQLWTETTSRNQRRGVPRERSPIANGGQWTIASDGATVIHMPEKKSAHPGVRRGSYESMHGVESLPARIPRTGKGPRSG